MGRCARPQRSMVAMPMGNVYRAKGADAAADEE